MATIQSTIQLVDRITSPVNNMISALNNLCGAYEDVDNGMQSGFDRSRIDSARAAINQAAEQVASCRQEIDESEESQENFNRAIRGGVQDSDELLKKIGGFVGAFASVATIKKAMDLSDELVSTTARIDMMNQAFNETNKTAIETSSLVDAVYRSAQDARGSFSDMAAVVAKFGNNARDAFSSQQEVIDFATLVQKQMTIAGASTEEASNAMLQLSQALGSGVLRGDELNSIFEQAPNLIQSIAEYLHQPIGLIRDMASEGEITADIVKNAIFAASDEINTQFEAMPMTWGQVWTSMQNTALMKFQPVLNKINELANSERFQTATNSVLNGLAMISTMLLSIMDLVGAVAIFFQDNWSVIEPIIMGIVAALAAYLVIAGIVNTINAVMGAIEGAKAAAQLMAAGATFAETAAQQGLNAALMACPITWIILLIIALIAIIYAVCQAIAKATGVANSGFGVICGGVMVVIAFFKNLGLAIANIALGIWEALKACGENIYVVFHNCIKGVQAFWYGLLSTVMTVVAGICAALNKIPFISFDYSGIEDKAQEYAQKAADAKNSKLDFTDVGAAFDKGMGTFETFQDGWVSEAFNSGAAWGDGVVDGINSAVDDIGNLLNGDVSNLQETSGYNQNQMASNVSDIAGNTARTADALDVSGEDLKYLRDIAERDTVNRFTTAEVKIEWNNTQNINSDMDLDGVVDYLVTNLQEAIETTAEGVHA